jgi:hypothetical protein
MQVENVTVAHLNSIGNSILQGDVIWLFTFSVVFSSTAVAVIVLLSAAVNHYSFPL